MRLHTLFIAALLLLASAGIAHADDPTRAGVVVQHGDGRVETACVEVEESSISGLELLERSGLDVTYDASRGAAVCAIDGEGCQFPAESCFCQCEGNGPCVYWSYWHLDADSGEWTYSQLGAGAYEVVPGTIDGWRWGAGTPGSTEAPPRLTFEEICAPAPEPIVSPSLTVAPSATATSSLQVMPSVTAEPQPSPASSPTPRDTPTVAPTFTSIGPTTVAQPDPTPTPSTPTLADASIEYVGFGLLVLALLGVLVWVQRR